MKRKVLLSISFVLIFLSACLTFNTDALDIDGTMNENQWKNAESYVLISTAAESNCGVDYAVVSVLSDESSNQIYLGFKVKLSDSVQESSSYGVAFSVNSDDFVYATPLGVSSFDRDKLNVESAVYAYSDSAFCAEVTLDLKYGIKSLEKFEVRLVDAHGSPSNVIGLKTDAFVSDDVSATETEQTSSVTAEVKTTAQSTEKPEKTTRQSTTKKQSTTKTETTKSDPKRTTTRKTFANHEGNAETVVDKNTTIYSGIVTSEMYTAESESVTTLTAKQIKLQKGLSYAAVTAIILLALGVCVGVNIARDKKDEPKDKKS